MGTNAQGSAAGKLQRGAWGKLAAAAEGIQAVSKHLGGWYGFEALRAKTLRAQRAREAARVASLKKEPSEKRLAQASDTSTSSPSVGFGARIPTLVDMAKRASFD